MRNNLSVSSECQIIMSALDAETQQMLHYFWPHESKLYEINITRLKLICIPCPLCHQTVFSALRIVSHFSFNMGKSASDFLPDLSKWPWLLSVNVQAQRHSVDRLPLNNTYPFQMSTLFPCVFLPLLRFHHFIFYFHETAPTWQISARPPTRSFFQGTELLLFLDPH